MVAQQGGVQLPAGGENADGDRQIETAGILGQVGRRQVHGDALVIRKLQPGVVDGAAYALARFLHFGIGQTHQRETGQAVGQVHFNGDGRGGQAEQGAGGNQGKTHP